MSNRSQQIADALDRLAPKLSPQDRTEVIEHALWSKGLHQASADKAAWLSLVAYIRHNFTDYEALLEEGYGPEAARHFCAEQINTALATLNCRKKIPTNE